MLHTLSRGALALAAALACYTPIVAQAQSVTTPSAIRIRPFTLFPSTVPVARTAPVRVDVTTIVPPVMSPVLQQRVFYPDLPVVRLRRSVSGGPIEGDIVSARY